jgi:hypothetical protein
VVTRERGGWMQRSSVRATKTQISGIISGSSLAHWSNYWLKQSMVYFKMTRRVWNSQHIKWLVVEDMELFINPTWLLHIVIRYWIALRYLIKLYIYYFLVKVNYFLKHYLWKGVIINTINRTEIADHFSNDHILNLPQKQ